MRTVFVSLLLLALAGPARSQTTFLGSQLDEIVDRASVGMQANLFGPSLTTREARWSVAVRPFIGVYGSDGILGGIGVAVHTARWSPWNLGVGFTQFEADVPTWTLAVSADRRTHDGRYVDVDVGVAAGYQHGPTGDGRYLVVEDPFGTRREVLIESLRLGHALLRVAGTLDLWFLRPTLEIAAVFTSHHVDGVEWDAIDRAGTGGERDDSGSDTKLTFGLGLGLDVAPAIVFAGLGVAGDAGYFQVAFGAAF